MEGKEVGSAIVMGATKAKIKIVAKAKSSILLLLNLSSPGLEKIVRIDFTYKIFLLHIFKNFVV
jgi:plastocyanin domain-containing protein